MYFEDVWLEPTQLTGKAGMPPCPQHRRATHQTEFMSKLVVGRKQIRKAAKCS